MNDEIVTRLTLPAGGTGAILRTRGRIWLAIGDPPRPATPIPDQGAQRLHVGGDRWLVGGKAPCTGVVAQVAAPAGGHVVVRCEGGAWLAMLEEPLDDRLELPVCFRDHNDRLIRLALRGACRQQPIEDSHEPCPACGADESPWILVTPRGLTPGRDGSFAACRACGHREPLGSWYGEIVDPDRGPENDTDEDDGWKLQAEREHRQAMLAMLADLPFTLYAPADVSLTVSGWGGGSASEDSAFYAPDHVTLVHEETSGGRVTSRTSIRDDGMFDDLTLARHALEEAIQHDAGFPILERSNAARSLWINARHRDAIRQATRATSARRPILIDDDPVEFVTAVTDQHWAAVGRLQELVLTVTGHDVALQNLRLQALDDPTGIAS